MRVPPLSAFFRISLFKTSHQTRVAGARAPVRKYQPRGESGQGVGPVARGSPNLRLAVRVVNGRQHGPDVSYITLPQALTSEPRGAWGTGWAVSRCACLPGPGCPDLAVVRSGAAVTGL